MDDKNTNWRHQVNLVDREELTVDGVVNLGSFDEKEIVMETEEGILIIRGTGLNIKQLNLDKGHISIEGVVQSLVYDEEVKQKKGLLGRLLR
ncbi:sporulation protein yabp/yqfc [Lucifera butyrica]|uniref:Sporulation protein yabp/yqfc n=1 Tax=Lucifera butyrica TaxID=1351585 RepID=A0A498R5G9_9FIRM|nr:sporulation protein YabP [Lucifera butyrica]VBB06399.1 sporulation protein yabp/yqfc [Lucifera butyrica]